MISGIKLSVRNYKCFSYEKPLEFYITEGCIAFIGANNSGKSAALKFLRETKHLWEQFGAQHLDKNHGLARLWGRQNLSFNSNLQDPYSVFHRYNEKDILINIQPVYVAGTGHNMNFTIRYMRKDLVCVLEHYYLNNSSFEAKPSLEDAVVFLQGHGWFDLPKYFLQFQSMAYLPAFRNAINQGAGVQHDVEVGTSFIDLWDSWKNGTTAQSEKAQSIQDLIKEIFGLSQLEINANRGSKSLNVVINSRKYDLSDVGSGISQFIIILSTIAFKEIKILLIDEPELNLHPKLQIELFRAINRLDVKLVIFATHYMGLARSIAVDDKGLPQIYSFKKDGNATQIRKYSREPNIMELLGELSYSSMSEIGTSKILLCEGWHDKGVLENFLRLYEKQNDFFVLPIGGAGLIDKEDAHSILYDLKNICSGLYVLIDSEKISADDDLCTKRKSFVKSCNKAEVPILVTKLRAIENYFSEAAIKNAKGAQYRKLAEYEKLGDASPSWAKHDNKFISSYMNKAELDVTDIGEFLSKI